MNGWMDLKIKIEKDFQLQHAGQDKGNGSKGSPLVDYAGAIPTMEEDRLGTSRLGTSGNSSSSSDEDTRAFESKDE